MHQECCQVSVGPFAIVLTELFSNPSKPLPHLLFLAAWRFRRSSSSVTTPTSPIKNTTFSTTFITAIVVVVVVVVVFVFFKL
jgi:hypothetical protein